MLNTPAESEGRQGPRLRGQHAAEDAGARRQDVHVHGRTAVGAREHGVFVEGPEIGGLEEFDALEAVDHDLKAGTSVADDDATSVVQACVVEPASDHAAGRLVVKEEAVQGRRRQRQSRTSRGGRHHEKGELLRQGVHVLGQLRAEPVLLRESLLQQSKACIGSSDTRVNSFFHLHQFLAQILRGEERIGVARL